MQLLVIPAFSGNRKENAEMPESHIQAVPWREVLAFRRLLSAVAGSRNANIGLWLNRCHVCNHGATYLQKAIDAKSVPIPSRKSIKPTAKQESADLLAFRLIEHALKRKKFIHFWDLLHIYG